jgi:hypothetical protein
MRKDSQGEMRTNRNCEGLKHAPGNTAEALADFEDNDVGREEWEEDYGVHEEQSANHGLLVAQPFSDVPVEDEAQDRAHGGAVLETGLPCGGNLILAVDEDAGVFLGECLIGVERAD